MLLHKAPHNSEALEPPLEGIHVSPGSVAVDDLLASITASPDDTAPALLPVHLSLVDGALQAAAHGGEEVCEVGHLEI